MKHLLDPLRFVVIAVSGWMNGQQLLLIDYLREENRILREHLGEKRLRRDLYCEPSAFAEVILGSRMQSHNIARVFEMVDAMQTIGVDIKVFESKPDPHNWIFFRIPSSKGLCRECGGKGYLLHRVRETGASE